MREQAAETRTEAPVVEGPNHELFVQVLAQIERTPERWRQQFYQSRTPCGTAFCFAGWAIALTEGPDGELERYFDSMKAEKLLGINDPMHGLFFATNTKDDLYRISAHLMGLDEQVLRDKVAAEVQA